MDNFDVVFESLRAIFADVLLKLQAAVDNGAEYTLNTLAPSPLAQHKGAPMFFGSVRKGKAYVSFHLFPLYTCPELKDGMSPELEKRMQGKSCFNFKTTPSAGQTAELKKLTRAGMKAFEKKNWA
jgi:hypothetical protein